jgi:solute carrier family 35 protein E3
MGEMPSFQLGVIGALFLSVASSVSIVICNKALMSNLGFPFGKTCYLHKLRGHAFF